MRECVFALIVGFFLAIGLSTAQAPAPDPFLSPLKKGTEIILKETQSGHRINLQSPGTHKVIACENDYVIIQDAVGVTITRIPKNAVLSISEIKIPK